jgi:hypothetical protein
LACSRLTEKPTKVGPYMLPKGVIVFPCLYVINNWSGNWEEPRKVRGRLMRLGGGTFMRLLFCWLDCVCCCMAGGSGSPSRLCLVWT